MLGGWMDVCFCALLLSRKHTRGLCGSFRWQECGSGSSCSSPPQSPLICRRYCLFILRMSNGGNALFSLFLVSGLSLSFMSENFNESLKKQNKKTRHSDVSEERGCCASRETPLFVVVLRGGARLLPLGGHALRLAQRCFQSHICFFFFVFSFWQWSHRAFCFRAVWCLYWAFPFHNSRS